MNATNTTPDDSNATLDLIEDDEISLIDLLQVIVEHLRLLVLGPLCIGLSALGICFLITPTFTATTKFLPPQQQQSSAASLMASLGALGGLAGAATGIKNPADQYVAFLQSRTVQDAMIDRFQLETRYEAKFREDARNAIKGNSIISSGKDGMISIDFSDKDPAFAAQVANAYPEELSKLLSRIAVTEAQQRRVFFEKQLHNAKDKLTQADQALKASGINSNALKSSPTAAVETLARLKANITAQEIKLSSMRGYLTESAPDFKQAQTELSAMRQQMARAEQEEPTSSRGGSDYIAKYRDYKYHETLFELFAKQYEMARIDEAREGAVIQVLDIAEPPERKAKPKKAMIAITATLSSGFALLLFVFARSTIKNASQKEETKLRIAALKGSWLRALGR
jgi:uncharacterized protein involved in exopolysaccharide biosynthesis